MLIATLSDFVILGMIASVSSADSVPNQLTAAEKAAGWALLFDGTTTQNWRGYRQQGFPAVGWVIEDGCLKVETGGKGGDIITTAQYADFELSLEWKVSPKGNSGIMYRVAEIHDTPWQTGPEFQILDDAGTATAADHVHSAGSLYDLHAPAAGKILKPVGEFNHARIRVHNNQVQHWVNGVKTVQCPLTGDEWSNRIKPTKFAAYEGFGVQSRGYIALQDHGDTIWFRSIKIRDLSAPMPNEVKLFDGASLKGWTHFLENGGAMENTWRVENGVLICSGSPAGYIRTEADHTNYILKLQWRFNPVTKQAGNSGVLLRLIGPDKIWPKSVEAQLHSGNAGDFWNIDDFIMKTDPARTNGSNTKKLLAAENPVGEWNSYEIIVDGSHVTLYVNGELVNEASDVQETAGKIALQSEGAEIHFRDIHLAPIE